MVAVGAFGDRFDHELASVNLLCVAAPPIPQFAARTLCVCIAMPLCLAYAWRAWRACLRAWRACLPVHHHAALPPTPLLRQLQVA